MKEQTEFCEGILADLRHAFPDYPPESSFTSNAGTVKLGHVLTITMPAMIARTLLNVYEQEQGDQGA